MFYLQAVALDDSDVTVWYHLGVVTLKTFDLCLARHSFEEVCVVIFVKLKSRTVQNVVQSVLLRTFILDVKCIFLKRQNVLIRNVFTFGGTKLQVTVTVTENVNM